MGRYYYTYENNIYNIMNLLFVIPFATALIISDSIQFYLVKVVTKKNNFKPLP